MLFRSMLKGLAQAHYYNCSLSTKQFDAACTHMRNFFEGPEYYRKNLTEWNAISLQGVINDNPEKSVYQCLQLLIDKLCKQQHAIDIELRTPRILTNKLVTACQGVPACRIATSNPSEDLAALINKLQSSVVAWERENPSSTQSQALFTDRRYHRDQDRGCTPDRRGGYRQAGSHGRTFNRPKAHCYVCQKEDCRSWRHTDKEQAKAKETYKSKFNNRTKGRFNNRFEEQFKQYITECEEGDEDSETEANDAFESLILDIESELNLEEPANEKESESGTVYLTAFGELMPNEATSISAVLANKAFSHSLTLEDMTKPTLTTDPFTYTLNTPSSRYTSDVFLGIVVDTGASRKSTAGYGQFQALQQSNPARELELDTSIKGQVIV